MLNPKKYLRLAFIVTNLVLGPVHIPPVTVRLQPASSNKVATDHEILSLSLLNRRMIVLST